MMPRPRFLQIHTLTSYTASLLNRDDSGLAKRLPYGDAMRTRISSQCLKRHWRMADDPHALNNIEGAEESVRSRDLVTDGIVAEARRRLGEDFVEEIAEALEPWFQFAVYGTKKEDRPKKRGGASKFSEKSKRQILLFGQPEIDWLGSEFVRLVIKADGDPDEAFRLGSAWTDGADVPEKNKGEKKAFLDNIKAMREGRALPEGLTSALFGRMVTSDPAANITAPVHVAHAFTVHEEQPESDYFTAVDDLSEDHEPGAGTIQETELTSGLFYGYVVVDLPGLLKNLRGDEDLAGKVLHNLIYLIAEVSPGAKLGSTAPYGRASLMLLEAGDRQPRSLAEAWRVACAPRIDLATEALSAHLAALDDAYATGEERRAMSLSKGNEIPDAERGSLSDLAEWARTLSERAVA